MTAPLKKTALHQLHLDLKAKMGEFADFDMPLQYSSVKQEALAVRNHCGIFDVSHMGEFFVKGPQAQEFIDYMICNDFKSAPLNKAVYSPLCREDGSVIDDLIAYKIKEDYCLICVNASNIQKDWEWFYSHISQFDCEIHDLSQDYSLLAIQGPKSCDAFERLGLEFINQQKPFSVFETELSCFGENEKIIIAKTGYTGEDGAEIFCSHNCAQKIWTLLLENGVTPCGLVARDLLRTEACFPLYGQEIHDEVTPLDSALSWTVKLDKNNFIGKEALQTYKPKYKLIKLILDKGIPRQGHQVLYQQKPVGFVTSGTMSVVQQKGIALAHIEKDLTCNENHFSIEIRQKAYPAVKVKNSFHKINQSS